jgi:polyhydroxyalkanoate synthesis regulator phasin
MDKLKNIVYAGFGIANEIKDKAEDKFNSLVEAGKKYDEEKGKHNVTDFFKTIEETTEKYTPKLDELKSKLESLKPEFLKKDEVEVEK